MIRQKLLLLEQDDSVKRAVARIAERFVTLGRGNVSTNLDNLSQLIKTHKPDVVLTNLYFREKTIQEAINTLNIVRRITTNNDIKVIVITECDNTAVYQYALLSHINGYICINSNRACNLSKTIAQMVHGPRIKPSRHWLTLKEWMVCHSLIASPNRSSLERAKSLAMSESNYYRILSNCQQKTGARSTLELAVKFMSPAAALSG